MSLIDNSYFFGELQIGQTSEQSVTDRLNFFITQWERKFFAALIGNDMYNKIIDPSNALVQKWIDLRDGKDYIVDDIVYHFDGIANNSEKRSVFANFIYCRYMENELTATGGAGEGKIQMQNATATTSQKKIIRAWNMMVSGNWELYQYLDNHEMDYPEFASFRHKDNFPGVLFKERNRFGI